jgi:hypothetical protein
MSGSAAMEYGFPSTHTANAVSVGLLIYHHLKGSSALDHSSARYIGLQFANAIYVFSIVAGRIYCGMHGFLDVLVGTMIGVLLWAIRFFFASEMDAAMIHTGFWPLLIVPIVLILVRTHPEPADDCPCFDDAVAFLGVVAGVSVGQWHLANVVESAQIPYDFSQSGAYGTALRVALGVGIIAIWRPTMKRALHGALPPIFRIIEKSGLSQPRKYFVPASQYEGVPSPLPDSTFFEPYRIPSLFSKIGRARSDSVGPQSPADVYESLAYKQYQKQQAIRRLTKNQNNTNHNVDTAGGKGSENEQKGTSREGATSGVDHFTDSSSETTHEEDMLEQEKLMSTLVIPRVRYDVEVVTKLIVYSGVAVIATDLCPRIFQFLGI